MLHFVIPLGCVGTREVYAQTGIGLFENEQRKEEYNYNDYRREGCPPMTAIIPIFPYGMICLLYSLGDIVLLQPQIALQCLSVSGT